MKISTAYGVYMPIYKLEAYTRDSYRLCAADIGPFTTPKIPDVAASTPIAYKTAFAYTSARRILRSPLHPTLDHYVLILVSPGPQRVLEVIRK